MATAKQRHDRALVAAHARLIGQLFTDSKLDLTAFIQRGELGSGASPLPYDPDVEAKVAEIHANGGKLIVPPE